MSESFEESYASEQKEYIELLNLWFSKFSMKTKESVFSSVSPAEWEKITGPAIEILLEQKATHPSMNFYTNLNERYYQESNNPQKTMFLINHMVSRAVFSKNTSHQQELIYYIQNILEEYPSSKVTNWFVDEWSKMLDVCEKNFESKVRLKIEQSIPASHKKLLVSNEILMKELNFVSVFSANKPKEDLLAHWNTLDKTSAVQNEQIANCLKNVFCFNYDLFEKFVDQCKQDKIAALFLKSITPNPFESYQLYNKNEKNKEKFLMYFNKTYPKDFMNFFYQFLQETITDNSVTIEGCSILFKTGLTAGLTLDKIDQQIEKALSKKELANEFVRDIMNNKSSFIKNITNPKWNAILLSTTSPKMIGTFYLMSELMGGPKNNQYPCYSINFADPDSDENYDEFYRINKKIKDPVLTQYKSLAQKRTLQYEISSSTENAVSAQKRKI